METKTMAEFHFAGLCRILTIAGLLMLLAGCGGMSRTDSPARVEERTAAPPPLPQTEAGSDVQIAAYTPPAQPQFARPQPKRAVTALMRRADEQRINGDLDGASASLERALRIAPEDAVLWHDLAEVRMAQQQHDRVVQLAAKSNALASPGDAALRSANWRLIAKARRAQGDISGAREADRRAGSLD
jgi:tetratricopeptide (TPR) repeat protein